MNLQEGLKLIGKIAAKTFVKWVLVVTTGSFISVIFFSICLFQSLHGRDYDGVLGYLKTFFLGNPLGFILVVGVPVFIVLYFSLANKVAIQSVIYEVWRTKASEFLLPRIQRVVERITDKSNTVSSFSDASVLRMRLLDANRNDMERSPVQRRILNFLFKKIKLDTIDFKNENLKLSDVIVGQIDYFVLGLSQPSFTLFFVLFVLQTAVFVGAEIIHIWFM